MAGRPEPFLRLRNRATSWSRSESDLRGLQRLLDADGPLYSNHEFLRVAMAGPGRSCIHRRRVSTPEYAVPRAPARCVQGPGDGEGRGEGPVYCNWLPPPGPAPPRLADLCMRALLRAPQVFTLTNLNGVRKREDLGQTGIEDMIQLSDLNEASLLWNLKIRYDKELIYTYTGSILVAVNPYKMFDIYGLDMVKKYEGQILGTLPPHLFAVGSSAYSHMSKEGMSPENQVVVISGESGSGKTESTKLVMQYLAAVNKAPSNLITEQILEASPLLESFGNAKTVRNDNSSRFGKYLEVHFKDGIIIGAKITEYLLEKSRIVTQAPEERNYHVFYEMLKGLPDEQKEKYGLQTPEKYFYLNQGGNCEIDGKFDGEDFQSLLSAMQVLGFTSDEQDTIFKILSSVLHLGNVYFHRKQLKHGQEGVEIGSDAEIRWTGHLLQLNVEGIKRSLTTKTTEARNERVFTPLTIDQALDARDAFAKALYSALFSWLVSRINQIVYKGTKRTAAISILDIFGFEDFKDNSFEQLCINYANENLQFYFNKHIFKLEQQEYAKEKIEWQTITYSDNLPVIHLITKKPVGILHLLDDESNFPKATDLSFLEKCHYNHALDELYSRPRMSSMEFGVKHYAGQVWYSVDGFLDKNRDTLRPDVVELLISSKVQMLSKMFHSLRSSHEATKTINKANGRFVTMKPRTPTVAARFHDSLQHLLESMSRCNPWFVRCIKPNNDKAPMKFDMPIVLEQLRYTGMLETIRIRKTGYPVRLKFSHFVERYRYLLPHRGNAFQRGTPYRELCRGILDTAAPRTPEGSDYQLGTSRVFLRESLERQLERERAAIVHSAALVIQRNVRGLLARRRYQAAKSSAVVIQAHVRGYSARKKYTTLRTGVVRAQAAFRGKRQRRRYAELKEEMKRRAEVEKLARERARAKAQREEQERVSRAVAGVNHLEIPAELAFIFSKLDDWQPIHSERNLVKVVGGVPSSPEKHHLPQDIDYHAFTKFTNIYFKSHLWGMKREPIKTPFLAKSKDIDYQDSLAIFKLILRFMNDNNLSGKKEIALGDYIVNKGIVNEKMRDEILCQLCNQTWKNDNDANNERGWLLVANCISVFPPSKTLFKYLLKYVSDHGYNGYKAFCQRKLLQCVRTDGHLARTYPPCLLEWRANRKRVNMALPVHFHDGESKTTPVDSWMTSQELATHVIRERGIAESEGWTLSVEDETVTRETNGFDYVLDIIAEMELAPAFPACKNSFLSSGDGKNRRANAKMSTSVPLPAELDPDLPPSPRRPAVPPPEPPQLKQAARRMSHDVIDEGAVWRSSGEKPDSKAGRVRSQSRDHTVQMALSRKSALNDRYFENKGRSRSMDNLLESEIAPPRKLENLGLSRSRLNDRYHSSEKVDSAVASNDVSMTMLLTAVSNKEYMTKAEALLEDNLESVSQRGDNSRKYSSNSRGNDLNLNGRGPSSPVLGQLPSDLLDSSRGELEFDYHELGSQARSEDDKGSYVKGQPRYIKSHYAGKRAAPGSHSSRAYIETRNSEKSEYGGKSSALSDTSEAPSLASHVRRVRVPSQASDVDQFLDDLFMPVLDGNLDELSDARSLAASIKGGDHTDAGRTPDAEVVSLTGPAPGTHSWANKSSTLENVDDYITELFKPIFVNASLQRLTQAAPLAESIKGGGRGMGRMETQQQSSAQSQGAAAFGFTPITSMTSPTPLMMSGMMSPPPVVMPTLPVYSPAAQSPVGAVPQFFPSPQGQEGLLPGAPGFMPVPIYNMQVMACEGVPGHHSSPPQATTWQQFGAPYRGTNIFTTHHKGVLRHNGSSHKLPGLSLPAFPGSMSPGSAAQQHAGMDMAAYQQNLQRAFLQSAMAQNMQIQQQLLAQNQALQQMLQQPAQPSVPVRSPVRAAPLACAQAHSPLGMHGLGLPGSQHQAAGLQLSYDSLDRSSKVSFREPENGELWSTEKRQSTSSMPPGMQQSYHSPNVAKPQQQQGPAARAQVHQGQSPLKDGAGPPRKLSPTKHPSGNPHTAFTSVLSELRNRKSSVESTYSMSNKVPSSGVAPPPPPPMPPPPDHGDPSETRPFLDPYGRAKTVRIGKWRWPPPKADTEDTSDSFLQFKMRQQQRKTTPQQQQHLSQEFSEASEGVEWEEFEVGNQERLLGSAGVSRKDSRVSSGVSKDSRDSKDRSAMKAFEVGASRPSPGSIGKLRISSEMRTKLEMVTANHSLRATNKPEKPAVIPSKREDKPVRKLEDNRRHLLEQQLAGRWGSEDSVDLPSRAVVKEEHPDIQQTNIVRSQVERMEKSPRFEEAATTNGWDKAVITNAGGWEKPSPANSAWRPAPPPPPVTPQFVDSGPAPAAASRASSFYSQSNAPALPRSPPPPIQPVKSSREHNGSPGREAYGMQHSGQHGGRDVYGNMQQSNDRDRRSSASTHLTDRMERIEIEESSEFLKPVDSAPPPSIDRSDLGRSIEAMKTKLFGPSSAAYFTYNRVAWRLLVKKEVFSPAETLGSPLALHLVFCQVVQDCLGGCCVRVSRDQRVKMKKLLDSYGVTLNNIHSGHQKVTIKKNVVDVAKDWPTYFARIFPVSGGHQNPAVQHLAVSHSGVRLLRREKSAPEDCLQVLDTFRKKDKSSASVKQAAQSSPDERRDQLERDMRNNWEELPATLKRRKEKLSQAVLAEFHSEGGSDPEPEPADPTRPEQGPEPEPSGHSQSSSLFTQDKDLSEISLLGACEDSTSKPVPTAGSDDSPASKPAVGVEDEGSRAADGDGLDSEQHNVMQLLSKSVSHDSLIDSTENISSSVASGSVEGDLHHNDSGTDINSPTCSTASHEEDEKLRVEEDFDKEQHSKVSRYSLIKVEESSNSNALCQEGCVAPDNEYQPVDVCGKEPLSKNPTLSVSFSTRVSKPERAPVDADTSTYEDVETVSIPRAEYCSKVKGRGHFKSAEEDAMSYYDSVVLESQLPHVKTPKSDVYKDYCDNDADCMLAHSQLLNDARHCKYNPKDIGIASGFVRRHVAMEIISEEAPAAQVVDACITRAKVPAVVATKWKRPMSMETLNKKPKTMATIVEEPSPCEESEKCEGPKLTVREILKRFEQLGGRVPPAGEGEEKSATLREIQETLRCLEEKVKLYENKIATQEDEEQDEEACEMHQKAVPRISAEAHQQAAPGMEGWTGGQQAPSHHQHHSQHRQPEHHQHQHSQQQQHQQQQQQQQQGPSLSLPAALQQSAQQAAQQAAQAAEAAEPVGQHDGKHSLLQFAMLHFRQSPEKFEMLKTADGSISGSLKVIESLKSKKNKGKKGNKENDWTWKEQVDLVKFTPVPIEQSLLRLETSELNELAVECFLSVMRYMGDVPMTPEVTEVKCVYTILMHCHKHESLRDEVYCQLMKQTTNNKSSKQDSCQRGWRLFSIVAAYFVCSDTLKPYLFKYLETSAYDKRRAFHGTATVCLHNLRKTFKYGGRKNVPSVEEITAISAGRNSKRQIYRLPGGTERVINTKSTTVVQDVIEEICSVINVQAPQEMEEFSLYCIVEGDTFTMPLAREEYILDVTTELHKNQQIFYLIFCRSVWHFPLRLDTHLYIEVVFNQIAPDYLEGLLLVMPGEQLDQDIIYDIAKMAALLHRAADMKHLPSMKETKFLLPKPALTVRDVKPAQWVNMVQSNWREVEGLPTVQAKAQVLDILSKWPLFGSSFFAVKRVSDPKERSDHILALNRHGVQFIDLVTHETLIHYPFSEVISTRKVKSEDGILFLDMKCGNLMQQRITRLQTDQAHEISRLIRQYITMEQRLRV